MQNQLKPNSNLRIVWDLVGANVFIGLYTTRDLRDKDQKKLASEEIDTEYNLCYNYGATNGELHRMHEGFGFFSTDKNRYFSSLVARGVNEILSKHPNANESVLEDKFRISAKSYIAGLSREDFVENIRMHASVS